MKAGCFGSSMRPPCADEHRIMSGRRYGAVLFLGLVLLLQPGRCETAPGYAGFEALLDSHEF